MMNFRIEPATIEHARAIYDVHASVWRENEQVYGIDPQDIKAYIAPPDVGVIQRAERLMAPNIFCVVAVVGSFTVGFCSATRGEGSSRIDSLYVLSEYRSEGAGSKLVFEVEEKLGHEDIFVDTHVANSRGKEFYRSHGFRPTGRLKDTVESGALVLASGAIFPQMELKREAK